MTDKPAATAPELSGTAANTPAPVEVKLGDATVKVDPATADALTKFQKSVEAAGVANSQKIAELSDQLAKLTAKQPTNPASTAPDLENLIFTNPKEALRLVKEDIRAEFNATLNATQQQADFWREFYKQNGDLTDSDWFVKSVMARDYGKMKTMQVPEAMKYLADTVKADILKLAPKKTKDNKADVMEGGNEATPPKSKSGEASESPQTAGGITGVLKARQAARRKAAGGASASA
jgi:hypothetical protein